MANLRLCLTGGLSLVLQVDTPAIEFVDEIWCVFELRYPLTLDYIHTGLLFSAFNVGANNPQLAAALAADAAGLVDQSREHFETALRQAHEVPIRILQPPVLYWNGRSLSTAADAGDRERGRAMVEAALIDFRSLEMVLHANLAEEFLRAVGAPSRRFSAGCIPAADSAQTSFQPQTRPRLHADRRRTCKKFTFESSGFVATGESLRPNLR